MDSEILQVALVGLDWDLLDLIENMQELHLAGVLDNDASAIAGDILLLGGDSDWQEVKASRPNLKVILAVDPPKVRKNLFSHYGSSAVVGLKSTSSHISGRATLGHGVIIQRGVHVMPKAKLGKACKLHLNVSVHHEVEIGDFCTIGPGAQLLGNVQVGEGTYIGAGAIIKQRCRIGKNATVGAGAVVVGDVPDDITVVGVPAKRISCKD